MGQESPPEQIVRMAESTGSESIAYTYTEPGVWMEYAYDIARIAAERGIKNVFVTNGYMTSEALKDIQPYLDAANVDLKGFTEKHYRDVCGARLKPVLDTLKIMKQLGIWVEVTTLIIPTLNDSHEELRQIAEFILSLGPETPWHVSRFHPTYKMLDLPPTPVQSIVRARQIGLEAGLRYVYSGNVPGDKGESTYCHNCGKVVIPRYGYQLGEIHLEDSRCEYCGAEVDVVLDH
jgi:pyruvate formate lyase activating enzyme